MFTHNDVADGPADISSFHDATCSAVPTPGARALERSFFAHEGRIVHKWHHYLPLYDRYFAPYRAGFPAGAAKRPIRMLEIGVSKGGSLEIWRRYFGPEAMLYGIDIDPACKTFDGDRGNHVRIGSQADPDFLKTVVAEMGGIDIVLDDGSHIADHQNASFSTLFPLLEVGGLYVVEDLHTAYWRDFGGGYNSQRSFVATVKQLIDDLHHWYHKGGEKIAASAGLITGLHVHDSIVFIEKERVLPPAHSQRGNSAQVNTTSKPGSSIG